MALTDKVALVTGAARGIGKAICEALLSEKVKVCITDILEVEGEATLKELGDLYGKENVIFYKLNVVDEKEFEDVVIKTKSHFGHLDILCNNAGCVNENMPTEIIKINLLGCINGIQIAHKYLANSKGEKGGTVINTASILGITPLYALPSYSASKAAVVALTSTWGHKKNVKLTNVKVNSVCPDMTDTAMLKSGAVLHQEEFKEIKKKIAKTVLKPSEIANGVLKILHDDVSGKMLVCKMSKEVYYDTLAEKDYSDELEA